MEKEVSRDIYFQLNKAMIVKFIEELQFEEVLSPSPKLKNEYELKVSETTSYLLRAEMGIWGNLQIEESSIRKIVSGIKLTEFTATEFIREIQDICGMDDETLAKFLEEASKTLYSDYYHKSQLAEMDMSEFVEKSFTEIDQLLPGHPKLLLNKGRLGWGVSDLEKFAPESQNSYQLRWIAVRKTRLLLGMRQNLDNEALLRGSLEKEERKSIYQNLSIKGKRAEDFFIFPVHPWQWDQHVKIHYQELYFRGDLIDLGERGDFYSPQTTLRTLSNKDHPENLDIKLSVSVLNTSCVRGITPKYIEDGHKVSAELERIISGDDYLTEKNLRVAGELSGVSCPHPTHREIKNAPYRYQELLGCVWRESVPGILNPGEKAIPTAALSFKNEGTSFIETCLNKANISPCDWLKEYFEHVVLPLYHLQLTYGIGLVSHGQNTILVMKNHVPSGMIIKDFHGDLRISKDSQLKDREAFKSLEVLPPEYLIHDLITGHFVTVLRYLSRSMKESCQLEEEKFYQILGICVESYLDKQGWRNHLPEKLNLLRAHFEKVLVNKVRFVAGYSETNTRLKPLLGGDIKNPIYESLWKSPRSPLEMEMER